MLAADDVEAKQFADTLYSELMKEQVEVIYDDRKVRPGVMFSDADLLGIPVRVIVSPRSLAEGCVEITTRDKTIQLKVNIQEAILKIHEVIGELNKSKID